MTLAHLDYRLSDGYVHHWLVAGPHRATGAEVGAADAVPCLEALLGAGDHDGQGPAEYASLQLSGETLTWRYARCLEDHLLDLTPNRQAWEPHRAYAYTQVMAPSASTVRITLAATVAASLYMAGSQVLALVGDGSEGLVKASCLVELREGSNPLVVCLGGSGEACGPFALWMRLEDPEGQSLDGLVVRLSTLARRPQRRLTCEQVFDYAYLGSPVVYKGDVIHLHWSDALPTRWNYAYGIQDELGRTYVSGRAEARASTSLNVGHPARLWERRYYVSLRAHPAEYYEENLRYERLLPVDVLDTPYARRPYGSYEERRREALEHAAKRERDPYGELAKMALGRWADLDAEALRSVRHAMERADDRAAAQLLALLGAVHRFGQAEAFPAWLPEEVEACVRAYCAGQLGGHQAREQTDGDRALHLALRQLIVSRYKGLVPGELNAREGWRAGETAQLLRAWLRARGTRGFPDWDASESFAKYVVALSHLSDLAEDSEIRELAAILLDKVHFSLALNTYQGVLGSTQGHAHTPMLLGPQLGATCGITRLLWGMGVWNQHMEGPVSLACSQYELPPLLGLVAVDEPDELWSQERHVSDPAAGEGRAPEVNKVTYRTPDYMLASAQSYRPGELGGAEHIWQATLGEDAVLFVNHPACMSEHDAYRPGFWRGNRVLPKVVQWKDVLIALHQLREDDPLGFTHAYLPVRAFDEYHLQGGWVFARRGQAYVALTASGGIELARRGPSAYRELRSYGLKNIWLCQLGRTRLDGSLDDFRAKVLATQIDWQGLYVRFRTLRGETVEVGWTEPLMVNGQEQPLGGYRHYDSPYCQVELGAPDMQIQWRDATLSLDFS